MAIANLVPRACDPWEGNEGSGIIRCRKPGILAKIELRIHFNGQSNSSLKRIIPEPSFPSQGSRARGTRLGDSKLTCTSFQVISPQTFKNCRRTFECRLFTYLHDRKTCNEIKLSLTVSYGINPLSYRASPLTSKIVWHQSSKQIK